MSIVWTLLRKDITRKARSPVGVLVLMAIPLAISLIFGLVFSPSGEQTTPRFTMLVVDRDNSFLSESVKSAFTQGQLADMVDLREVSPVDGYEMMNRGKAAALLDIPEGFGDGLLDGRNVRLRLVKNPAEQFMPDVAEKATEIITLLLDYGIRILSDPIQQIRSAGGSSTFPDLDEWTRVGRLIYASLERVQKYAIPPVISLETETTGKEEETTGINFFALFLPGMALMSLLFIAEIAFRDLAVEHASGQLKRIFVTPTGPFTILMGKLAYSFTLVFLSFIVMAVCGIALFRISFESPALFFLGGAISSLACTGVMGLVYSFAGEVRRGEAVTSIVVIMMCMVGGSFIPVQALPGYMTGVARFTVNYWSIDLLTGSISSSLGTNSPLLDIVVLALTAVVTISLSVPLLRRRIVRGASA